MTQPEKKHRGVTAFITSTLTSDGQTTQASVVTSLDVTGRVAQFGRGILGDVSKKLIDELVFYQPGILPISEKERLVSKHAERRRAPVRRRR